MKISTKTLTLLLATGFVLAGCPGDDAPATDTTGEDTGTTAGPTTNTTPPTTATESADTTAGPDTDTATDTTAGTATEGETDTDTDGEDPFQFDETPFEDYTQVDRQGFPAVNTGLNLLGDKDQYNAATPADDAALMFVTNVLESLETLHLGVPDMQTADNTGLDDDILAAGLVPCVTPPLPMDNCDDQGAPFVFPDVIEIDLDEESVFPNGRQLDVPVMDIILAVILLDLDENENGITRFLDLDNDGVPGPSLNPLANDLEFGTEFPYLAAPHE